MCMLHVCVCVCVCVYLCICVFVYLCMCVYVYDGISYFGQLSEEIGFLAVANHGKGWVVLVASVVLRQTGCYQPALSHQ